MSQNHKDALETQIREAYGRLVYTYTAHLKQAERLVNKNKHIRYWQIVFSAVTTGGILTSAISDQSVLVWVSGIASTALLGLNLYIKDFNLADEIRKHRTAADDLWVTREKYVSLLTDLETLSKQEIREMRDQLQTRTAEIYKLVPATDAKSYKAAEKALKNEEKHFFTSDEIDRILPEHLRKNLLKTKLHGKS